MRKSTSVSVNTWARNSNRSCQLGSTREQKRIHINSTEYSELWVGLYRLYRKQRRNDSTREKTNEKKIVYRWRENKKFELLVSEFFLPTFNSCLLNLISDFLWKLHSWQVISNVLLTFFFLHLLTRVSTRRNHPVTIPNVLDVENWRYSN